MRLKYSVKEVFATLQGEGHHAGCPAVFVRFTGCNMWSGNDSDRTRDVARSGAACPAWCDTDFRGAGVAPVTLDGVLRLVDQAATGAKLPDIPLVVFTGGEPLLQLTSELATATRDRFLTMVAIETNGSLAVVPDGVGWVCVSPKQAPASIRLRSGDEIKVVYPAYNPLDYDQVASGFTYRWVSAEATTAEVGKSLIAQHNLRAAADFCITHPQWHLTLQSHKIVNLP